MSEIPPTVANTWIANRIAEYPTLYPHGDQVIFNCVIGKMGSTFWDKNGLLKDEERYWNSTKKKFTKHPLQIPLKTAYSMVSTHGDFIRPYYDLSGPINKMPVNIDESWLLEISMFLSKWGKFSMDDFKMIATVQCMLYYGVRENPNAHLPQRTIDEFEQFHKKIPTWQAMVASIYYQKQYAKVDPKTYQGIDI